MEKKYQVFISSTYKDLIEARSKVRDAILSMMHFPVGMEMFNAADEEQWEIIQETIDSSDYYVLILGQRYGSVIESGSDAGISYTEKEFRYAREKKIPVLVFIIDDDVAIKPEFIEKDPESIKKLADFKTEAKKGRTVQWWTNIDELAREVSESLHQQMDRKKRPGWIRGDAFDIEASHAEILSLNKKIRELEQENAELKSQIVKRVPELMAAVVLDQQDDEEVDGKGLKTHGKLLIDSSDNAIKIQLYHNDGECYKNKYEPLDLSCVESHLKKYVHVVNELDVPILCMGLNDVVVSASPGGILVSDKEQSSYIKPFVNMLDHQVMFAEESWGNFKVIDIDKESMTIKVTLNAGHRMNYHSHQHRDEVWTVIAGKGKTIVDGMEQNVKAGDVITMSAAV